MKARLPHGKRPCSSQPLLRTSYIVGGLGHINELIRSDESGTPSLKYLRRLWGLLSEHGIDLRLSCPDGYSHFGMFSRDEEAASQELTLEIPTVFMLHTTTMKGSNSYPLTKGVIWSEGKLIERPSDLYEADRCPQLLHGERDLKYYPSDSVTRLQQELKGNGGHQTH